MTDTPPTLDSLIAACAAASGLRVGVSTPAHVSLALALATYPELAAEARARLGAIPSGALLRDHLSRWLQSTLQGALPTE